MITTLIPILLAAFAALFVLVVLRRAPSKRDAAPVAMVATPRRTGSRLTARAVRGTRIMGRALGARDPIHCTGRVYSQRLVRDAGVLPRLPQSGEFVIAGESGSSTKRRLLPLSWRQSPPDELHEGPTMVTHG
jgi:hypothetical protein